MKTFGVVYDRSRKTMFADRQSKIDNDKSRLVAAIKSEYGIDDFSYLSESVKVSFRTMINEMWSKDSGLNEKGRSFISEGRTILTKDSTKEQVEEYFKKKLKSNVGKCMQNLVQGDRCEFVQKLKGEIEMQTGKELSVKSMKKWFLQVCCESLNESMNETGFGMKS